MEKEHTHGDFAEGQEGSEEEHGHHTGSFAEGQSEDHPHPKTDEQGDFA